MAFMQYLTLKYTYLFFFEIILFFGITYLDPYPKRELPLFFLLVELPTKKMVLCRF